MWNPTNRMEAINSAKADLGEPAPTAEVSIVGGDLRVALRSAAGDLLALYSVSLDGTLTRLDLSP